MTSFLKRFFANESGAITVDWVVLVALIVGLVAAALPLVSDGTEEASGTVGEFIELRPVDQPTWN